MKPASSQRMIYGIDLDTNTYEGIISTIEHSFVVENQKKEFSPIDRDTFEHAGTKL